MKPLRSHGEILQTQKELKISWCGGCPFVTDMAQCSASLISAVTPMDGRPDWCPLPITILGVTEGEGDNDEVSSPDLLDDFICEVCGEKSELCGCFVKEEGRSR